jgi:hypothetical protein
MASTPGLADAVRESISAKTNPSGLAELFLQDKTASEIARTEIITLPFIQVMLMVIQK